MNHRVSQETSEPSPLSRRAAGSLLRRNFVWMLVGNIVWAICQMGLLAAVIKIAPEECFGRFALGLAVSMPVVLLFSMQLASVQARDVGGRFSFADYLIARVLSCLISMSAIFVIAQCAFTGLSVVSITLVGIAKSLGSISDIFHGLYQKHERMERIAVSRCIAAVAGFVAPVALLAWTHSETWMYAGMIGAAVTPLVYDVLAARSLARIRPAKKRQRAPSLWVRLRSVAAGAWPLGIVVATLTLAHYIPQYFIEYAAGPAALGVVSALAYPSQAGQQLVAALGQSALPRFAQYFHVADAPRFFRLLAIILAIYGLLGAITFFGAVFGGKLLLTALYTEEFARRSPVFVWFMGAAALNYLGALGAPLTAAGRFHSQMILVFITTITMAIACARLIPAYGFIGAGMAVVATAAIRLITTYILVGFALFDLRRQWLAKLASQELLYREPQAEPSPRAA